MQDSVIVHSSGFYELSLAGDLDIVSVADGLAANPSQIVRHQYIWDELAADRMVVERFISD